MSAKSTYKQSPVNLWMEKYNVLKAENARLRAALTGIQTMADEDIREATEGVFTSQIEADARAALNYTAGEES